MILISWWVIMETIWTSLFFFFLLLCLAGKLSFPPTFVNWRKSLTINDAMKEDRHEGITRYYNRYYNLFFLLLLVLFTTCVSPSLRSFALPYQKIKGYCYKKKSEMCSFFTTIFSKRFTVGGKTTLHCVACALGGKCTCSKLGKRGSRSAKVISELEGDVEV